MEVGIFIKNVVFSVILCSIVINSILIPLIAREKILYRIYERLMFLHGKVKAAVTKTQQEQKQRRRRRSRARDLANEMLYPEVVADVFREQDIPGALNHPESSNTDVAD